MSGGRRIRRRGLHDAGQFGEVRVEQGAGGELGDAAAAGGGDVEQRAVVEGLHHQGGRVLQQRAEQAGDEVRAEVGEVGVDVDEDVAGGDGEGLPQHLALAGAGACRREDVVAVVDGGAGPAGDLRGAVDGAGVDDDHLVDEGDEGAHAGDDLGDGRLLVQCGQHDADAGVALAAPEVGEGQSRQVEVRLANQAAASGCMSETVVRSIP